MDALYRYRESSMAFVALKIEKIKLTSLHMKSKKIQQKQKSIELLI